MSIILVLYSDACDFRYTMCFRAGRVSDYWGPGRTSLATTSGSGSKSGWVIWMPMTLQRQWSNDFVRTVNILPLPLTQVLAHSLKSSECPVRSSNFTLRWCLSRKLHPKPAQIWSQHQRIWPSKAAAVRPGIWWRTHSSQTEQSVLRE